MFATEPSEIFKNQLNVLLNEAGLHSPYNILKAVKEAIRLYEDIPEFWKVEASGKKWCLARMGNLLCQINISIGRSNDKMTFRLDSIYKFQSAPVIKVIPIKISP